MLRLTRFPSIPRRMGYSSCKNYRLCCFSVKGERINDIKDCFQPVATKRSYIVVKHDPTLTPEEKCKYKDIHYHCLVKFDESWEQDTLWNKVSSLISEREGGYFTSVGCYSIKGTIAYFKKEGKTVVLSETNPELDALWKQIEHDSQPKDKTMEKPYKNTTPAPKTAKKVEETSPFTQLVELIKKNGVWSEQEFVARSYAQQKEQLLSLYKEPQFSQLFEKAKTISAQPILNMSFTQLCKHFLANEKLFTFKPRYENIENSVKIMKNWAACQQKNIYNVALEIKSFIDLDKRPKNCLYIQGAANSGKSLITNSIANLCQVYNQVVPCPLDRFIWKDSANKRLIVAKGSDWTEKEINLNLDLLKGRPVLVKVPNGSDAYIKATPIIVTCSQHMWTHAPKLKEEILSHSFTELTDLQEWPLEKKLNLDLHPLWIERILQEGPKSYIPVAKAASRKRSIWTLYL